MGTKNIAVFIGGLQFDSQRKFVEGVWDRVKKDNNRVFMFASNGSTGERFNVGEMKIYSLPRLTDFDGFIFYSATIYDDPAREHILKALLETKIPCISINVRYPGMLCVADDNWDVMQDLVEGLLSKRDIKTVNCIAGDRFSRDNSRRCASVTDALARHKIELPAERVYYGDFQADSGRKAVNYFKDKGLLDADLYICMNDQMALGAYYALQENGIKVPEDAMITGFDHIFMARNHTPSITTVDRDERLLGQRAYEMLMDAIAGDENIYNEELPCRVCWGGSSDFENQPIDDPAQALNHFTRMKLRTDRYAAMVNDASAMMSSVKNLDSLTDVMKSYIPRLECNEFYLCINDDTDQNLLRTMEDGFGYKDSQEINTEYSEHMKLELGFCNDRFHSGELLTRGDIIPGGVDKAKSGSLYVVCPVHYLERCYGYVAICNSWLPMESNYFHMFVMTIANGLEQIRETVQLNNMIKHLDNVWTYDALTRVYNRSGFMKYADQYINRAKEQGKKLLVIFLDLDRLKVINDELGHDMGDLMIKATADILMASREQDELVMRYGGDEFVLLGCGYDSEGAEKYVQRIHMGMEKYNQEHNPVIPLESSIGYCLVECDIDEPLSSLIKIADQKMYDIKKEKRRARLLK